MKYRVREIRGPATVGSREVARGLRKMTVCEMSLRIER